MLLAILPPVARGSLADLHGFFLFVGVFCIKGIAIPAMLFRSLSQITAKQGVEAVSSRHLPLLAGGVMVLLGFSSLPLFSLPTAPFPPLIVPAALSTLFIGFFLLISQRKAISQVLGFLVMDNGIFLFGMTLMADFPLTVEMGVLLDLLVGVFVMGIIIYHIHKTFDHIDTTVLSSLRDSE